MYTRLSCYSAQPGVNNRPKNIFKQNTRASLTMNRHCSTSTRYPSLNFHSSRFFLRLTMQSRQISFHYVCPHPQGRNVSIKRSLIFINNSRFIEHAILYINCRTQIGQSHFSRDFGSEQHEFEPRSLSCIFDFHQSRSQGRRK